VKKLNSVWRDGSNALILGQIRASRLLNRRSLRGRRRAPSSSSSSPVTGGRPWCQRTPRCIAPLPWSASAAIAPGISSAAYKLTCVASCQSKSEFCKPAGHDRDHVGSLRCIPSEKHHHAMTLVRVRVRHARHRERGGAKVRGNGIGESVGEGSAVDSTPAKTWCAIWILALVKQVHVFRRAT